jgi:predicted phosphodiesterase
MVRIVFAADSHLNRRYARMSPDQLAARRGHLRAGWQQSVDFAIAEAADYYVHGGDLFDSPNPRAVELVWSAGQFQRLHDAGVQVLLIGGNHDIPKTKQQGATPQRLFDAVRLAHVFTRSNAVEWHTSEVRGTRIAFGGLPPDPRLGPGDDPLDRVSEPIVPPAADFVVLLTHYAVEGLLHPLAEEATIRRASVAALAGRVDYLFAGHLHEGHDLDIGGVRVLFPGPTERMSFGELNARPGFAVLAVDGGRPCDVTVRQVRINPQPMLRETVSASDFPSDDPTGYLASLVRRLSAPDQILQLRLEGPLPRSVYQALRFLDVWHVGNELNFYFDLDRHKLTVAAPDAPELSSSGGERISPRGEIGRVADGFARSASSDEERAIIDEARSKALERYGAVDLE